MLFRSLTVNANTRMLTSLAITGIIQCTTTNMTTQRNNTLTIPKVTVMLTALLNTATLTPLTPTIMLMNTATLMIMPMAMLMTITRATVTRWKV